MIAHPLRFLLLLVILSYVCLNSEGQRRPPRRGAPGARRPGRPTRRPGPRRPVRGRGVQATPPPLPEEDDVEPEHPDIESILNSKDKTELDLEYQISAAQRNLGNGVAPGETLTCEDGWEQSLSGRKCFRLHPGDEDYQPHEAKFICERVYRARVAQPESEEELQWIHETFLKPQSRTVWYGAVVPLHENTNSSKWSVS